MSNNDTKLKYTIQIRLTTYEHRIFAHVNSIFFLIGLFVLGFILKQQKIVPAHFYRLVNRFIIFVPLPALTLYYIPNIPKAASLLYPIASAWLIFFLSILFVFILYQKRVVNKYTAVAIILTCGLGNTSFVGYPILELLYGKKGVQYGIMVDQPGTFLLLSTFGIIIAASMQTGQFSMKTIFKRLFGFPPFLCFLFAMLAPPELFTTDISNILKKVGSLMVPLALLSIGMQFEWNLDAVKSRNFILGLSYKLIFAPLAVYLLYHVFLGKTGLMIDVSVIQCAMPPMITGSIIASEYGHDEQLANALATFGIPFSVITIFIWSLIL